MNKDPLDADIPNQSLERELGRRSDSKVVSSDGFPTNLVDRVCPYRGWRCIRASPPPPAHPESHSARRRGPSTQFAGPGNGLTAHGSAKPTENTDKAAFAGAAPAASLSPHSPPMLRDLPKPGDSRRRIM
jgi:hypothetical protein